MGIKAKFLQLPLKAQIFTSLIIITAIVSALIIFLSGEFASVHEKYMFSKKKEYFFNMKQQIIERNIFLMNLCLLQYEFLIKYYNYKLYYYLKHQFIYSNNIAPSESYVDSSKIIQYDPSRDTDPDSTVEDSIYIYCFSKYAQYILPFLIKYLKSSYIFHLNNRKGALNFRIPYYGNVQVLGFFVTFSPENQYLIAPDKSLIKKIYDRFNGNMNKFVEDLSEISEYNYNRYKKIFINYEKKDLYFLDIMFKSRHYIFENYTKITDEIDKEEYIRNQSIFFQNIFYENDTSMFFDGWNTKNAQFHGHNSILKDYLNFILFHLSSKIEISLMPIYHEKNEIASKSLCYYNVMKQMAYINVTSNEKIKYEQMTHIYNEIFNKDNISINDCYFENYYDMKLSQDIKTKEKIYDYHDLKYTNKAYMFQLREGDINSYVFQILFSYPNYLSLKEVFPNFFSFDQIDFSGFSFNHEILKMIDSSSNFFKNIKYFMILCLLYNWFLLLFIIRIIYIRVVKDITEPIIRLTNIVNLNSINDINQNEDIFKYSLDEEINDFFFIM